MKHHFYLISFVLLTSCKSNDAIQVDHIDLLEMTYNQAIASIDEKYIRGGVLAPNEDGAIGRNKESYFHVRFQLGMNTISDFAIAEKRVDALEATVQAIGYAFSHQKPTGDFELSIPEELQGLGEPTEADLASGVSFFGSSLGLSLLSLSRSTWYSDSIETQDSKIVIDGYTTNIQSMLDYLKASEEMLLEIDKAAPNRLLFNAVAFYSLGTYLSDNEAKSIALSFTAKALALQDTSNGYFIEGGGWDSSYNGVANQLGLELFMILEPSKLKDNLKQAIEKSARWQLSRIKDSGEICTEGNTRVFDGGESFLGEEKRVDYAKTAKSLIYLSALTDNPEFTEIADQILNYYD